MGFVVAIPAAEVLIHVPTIRSASALIRLLHYVHGVVVRVLNIMP